MKKKKNTNQDVDERGNDNGAVTTQKRIGDECPQQRKQRRGAGPGVDILGGGGGGLAEWAGQIGDEVRADPIVSKPLRHFHAYDETCGSPTPRLGSQDWLPFVVNCTIHRIQ